MYCVAYKDKNSREVLQVMRVTSRENIGHAMRTLREAGASDIIPFTYNGLPQITEEYVTAHALKI